MDYLLESAKTWEKLLNYKYIITYSNKNKFIEINVSFEDIDFHHLAGFQYANDVEIPMVTKNSLYKAVKKKKITQEMLSKSVNFESMILPRLKVLYKLEDLLDKNFSFYKYNPKYYSFYTDINASFVIANAMCKQKKFFFIIKAEDNQYKGCSIFEETTKDFLESQKRINILKLEKCNTITNKSTVLYENSNYKNNSK